MKNIKARALAVLMTLVMVVGILPMGALAEGDSDNSDTSRAGGITEYHIMNSDNIFYREIAAQINQANAATTESAIDPADVSIDKIEAFGSDSSKTNPDFWSNGWRNGKDWYYIYNVWAWGLSNPECNDGVKLSKLAGINIYAHTSSDKTVTAYTIPVDRLSTNTAGIGNIIELYLTELTDYTPTEPTPASYTYTIEYNYNDNSGKAPVPQAVLEATLARIENLPEGVIATPGQGKIDFRISEDAVKTDGKKKLFDFAPFIFEALADENQTKLHNRGQLNQSKVDVSKPESKSPKLIYKNDGGETPQPTKLDAWYFIRTDGLVPMENGSTGYPSEQYLPDHNTNGGLPGTVLKANSWSENYGPIVGNTINGIALSEAFAKVQGALADKPNQTAIDAALSGVKGYNPETHGVMWYVVKTADKGNDSCPGYHVDGVLYTKGEDPTQVRVLNYLSNIQGDKKELLAYSVHGLGTSATVGSLLPTREGYDFMGWNTERNGSGTDYKAGDALAMDEDRTLYAQWKLKGDPQPPEKPTTKVEIFHFYVGGNTEDDQVHDTAAEAALPGGGTVSRDYKGITKDYVNGLNTMEFYKDDLATRNAEYTGYTVYAYNDKGEGGNTPIVFDGGEPLDLTNVKTLRIHLNYYQTRYSVVYSANGGIGDDFTKRYNTAKDYTILDNTGEGNPGFTREGYTFAGWSTDKEGTVKVEVGAPGTALEKNESVTYYAQWTKNEVPTPTTYRVTYEYTGSKPDGVNPPADEKRYEANAEVTLLTAPIAPTNYTFGGWVLPEGVTVENGKFSMPDHDVTITGNWTYTAPSGGGGDSGPTYRTVTVNYLEQDSNKVLADAYTLRDTYNSAYDVSAQAGRAIDGYAISSTDGETSGRLLRNLTINVYYTAVVDIPEEDTPLAPGPDTGDNGGTDIPDEETPPAPLPDTGDNGGTTGDDTVIEEENPPLGNLPQTGTTAEPVNAALTLGALALALSMATAGLTISLTRKKEDEQ